MSALNRDLYVRQRRPRALKDSAVSGCRTTNQLLRNNGVVPTGLLLGEVGPAATIDTRSTSPPTDHYFVILRRRSIDGESTAYLEPGELTADLSACPAVSPCCVQVNAGGNAKQSSNCNRYFPTTGARTRQRSASVQWPATSSGNPGVKGNPGVRRGGQAEHTLAHTQRNVIAKESLAIGSTWGVYTERGI